ncbi:MAG: insulinase family protein [Armatimonadetes bacterium]|nr:insulinase family protein [Armatimonadota bacterium]
MPDLIEHTLSNGLRVVLSETHTAPVATLWVWYRVGSRNEVPGLTGVSHWVEHMLFKGTTNFAKGDLPRIVARHGGSWNAFTWKDYTAYYEVLPSEHLELALRLESDRMHNALFDPQEVDGERTVIISEREGLENFPQFYLSEEVEAAALKAHPYRYPVIGWKEDLRAITREDLYRHYRTHYHPANAVAVVAGDFDRTVLRDLIERYFGSIPRGPAVPDVRVHEPRPEGERRVIVRRPGATGYLHIAFHAPAASHPDHAALRVLDGILSGFRGVVFSEGPGGRSSRLYRALVDRGLATEASSAYSTRIDPTLFHMTATVRTGVDPEAVERAVDDEIARLCEEPVGEVELAKVKKQARAQCAYAHDGVFGQAVLLGAAAIVDSLDLYHKIMDRLEAVDAEAVQAAARRYFDRRARTTGWFIPEGAGSAARPAAAAYAPSPPAWWTSHDPHGVPHSTAATRAVRITPDTVLRRVLRNGLVLLVHRNPANASVVFHGYARAAAMTETPQQAGLARFVAATLERGTERRTSHQIGEALDRLGATLAIQSHQEVTGFSARTLVMDAATVLGIVAEVLTSPAFPEDEVEKVRGELLTVLREMGQDTQRVAERVFRRLAYPPDHPHHRFPEGAADVVAGLRRQDLLEFHRRWYRPDGAILAVVGDVDPDATAALVEQTLGTWPAAGDGAVPAVPPVSLPRAPVREAVGLPGKSQSDIALGVPGITRTSPDYHEVMMADIMLGRLGMMGRLGANVREKQGMAYYVYSRLHAGLLPGPWMARAGVNPVNVERAIDSILHEVKRLQTEPIDAGELEDCRNYLSGSLALRLETNQGMAQALADIELYGLGLDYLLRFPGIVRGIGAPQIQEAARRRFPTDACVIAVAGPE